MPAGPSAGKGTRRAVLGVVLAGLSAWGCQATDEESLARAPLAPPPSEAGAATGGAADPERVALLQSPGRPGSLEDVDLDPLLDPGLRGDVRTPVAPAVRPESASDSLVDLLEPVLEHLEAVDGHLRGEAGGAWLDSVKARDRRLRVRLDRLRSQVDLLVERQAEALAELDATNAARESTDRQAREWQRELEWASLQLQDELDAATRISLRKKVADLKSRILSREVEAREQARGLQAESSVGAGGLQARAAAAEQLRLSASSFCESYSKAMEVVAASGNPSEIRSVAEARREARALVRIARDQGRAVDRELRRLLGSDRGQRP